ncbi:hypothetical protein FXO38_24613 [Capsicum annuum]|nr:hypothetical protein FXO38_24613 [Capsicum annuum]
MNELTFLTSIILGYLFGSGESAYNSQSTHNVEKATSNEPAPKSSAVSQPVDNTKVTFPTNNAGTVNPVETPVNTTDSDDQNSQLLNGFRTETKNNGERRVPDLLFHHFVA